MSGVWTLEDELCDMAALPRGNTAAAIAKLGLAPAADINDISLRYSDWYRGGAETYLLQFKISAAQTRQSSFVMKACIALGDLSGTGGIVQSWMDRRSLLSTCGVEVSTVFGVHSSTLLEEWIPFSLDEALAASIDHPGRTASLMCQLGFVAGVLTREGFPVIHLGDLRSRGRDVVIVDVGEDLGPPGLAATGHSQILDQATAMAEAKFGVNASSAKCLARGFESAMARQGHFRTSKSD